MKAGWQTRKLGEICEIERGGSPRPIDTFLTNDPKGINWIKIGDTKNVTKYITKTEEKIRPEGAKRSRMVYEGDFILSNSMSFGRPYIMKTTGCIHDGWLVLRQPKVDPDYLYHVLSSDLVFSQFDRLSAQQFMEMLFGKLPEFFKDEAELRTLWSAPDTRARLLQGLAEKGFGREQMAEMQKIIDAEKSDLFDVLAHIAYALPPLTREERATKAKVVISTRFNSKQQVFLDFVLSQYIKVGVQELDQEKLSPLLKLKYNNAITDAVADLGRPEEIGKIFYGFQKYLYQQVA